MLVFGVGFKGTNEEHCPFFGGGVQVNQGKAGLFFCGGTFPYFDDA